MRKPRSQKVKVQLHSSLKREARLEIRSPDSKFCVIKKKKQCIFTKLKNKKSVNLEKEIIKH